VTAAAATPASPAPPSTPAPGAPQGPVAGGGASPVAGGALAGPLRSTAMLLREAGRHVMFPIVLVLALVGFLMLQGAADRRDPKLALAPVWRSRYLWIPAFGRGRDE
jgi:hypothetical protein